MSGVPKPTEAELVTMFCTITPLVTCIKPVLDEALRAAQDDHPYAVTNAVEKMLELEKRLKNLRHMAALAEAADRFSRRAY